MPGEAADPPLTVDALSADLLSSCLAWLEPADLKNAESACRKFRATVIGHSLWRQACERALPSLHALSPAPDASQLPPPLRALAPPAAASATFKRLSAALSAPDAPQSLLAGALACSSMDNEGEHEGQALHPMARTRQLLCYWSSRGAEDVDSSEALAFRLAHPLCVVRAVQLRPFRAWFQPGKPLYASQRLRVRIGGIRCFGTVDGAESRQQQAHATQQAIADVVASVRAVGRRAGPGGQNRGSGGAVGTESASSRGAPVCHEGGGGDEALRGWISREFEVERRDELQTFLIPPTLCVGAYLRVDLIGRTQRQQADDLYYTCVCYVRALGTPLYNFIVRPPAAADGGGAGWQLVYNADDPLHRSGGLERVSEGGRMLHVHVLRQLLEAGDAAAQAVLQRYAALLQYVMGLGPNGMQMALEEAEARPEDGDHPLVAFAAMVRVPPAVAAGVLRALRTQYTMLTAWAVGDGWETDSNSGWDYEGDAEAEGQEEEGEGEGGEQDGEE